MTSQPGWQTITIPIISRSKNNQTMKFDQSVEYIKRFFCSKIMQEMRKGD